MSFALIFLPTPLFSAGACRGSFCDENEWLLCGVLQKLSVGWKLRGCFLFVRLQKVLAHFLQPDKCQGSSKFIPAASDSLPKHQTHPFHYKSLPRSHRESTERESEKLVQKMAGGRSCCNFYARGIFAQKEILL